MGWPGRNPVTIYGVRPGSFQPNATSARPWHRPPSSCFLIFSASSLLTPSLTAFGAPSTRSFASFRPRLGDRAHFLDNIDLLRADSGEDDVELRLLLDSGGGSGRLRPSWPRGRGGNAPFLLEHLGKLGGLEHGEAGKLVDDFLQDQPLVYPRKFLNWFRSAALRRFACPFRKLQTRAQAGARCIQHASDLARRRLDQVRSACCAVRRATAGLRANSPPRDPAPSIPSRRQGSRTSRWSWRI